MTGRQPCIHGQAIGSADAGHIRSGPPRSRNERGQTLRLRWTMRRMLVSDASTSPPKANLTIPASFGNSNRVLQLGNIDSDKSLFIVCHGSSSCDEDRSARPSNPRKTSVGRTTSGAKTDIRSYGIRLARGGGGDLDVGMRIERVALRHRRWSHRSRHRRRHKAWCRRPRPSL